MRGLLMDIYVRAEGLAAKYARFTRAPLPVDATRDARRGVAVGTAPRLSLCAALRSGRAARQQIRTSW